VISNSAITNAKIGEIISVGKGGTGANLSSTSGYVKQASVGANFTTTSSIPVADVTGAVQKVNGISPDINGNVAISIGSVTTGILTTRPATSANNGDFYVVSNDGVNNGLTYIWDGSQWHEVTPNQAATDARYVQQDGDTMNGDLLMSNGKKITLNYTPVSATDAVNKSYVDAILPITNAKIGETILVVKGGTGATTLTGYVKGNGTAAMTASTSIPVADVTGAQTTANLSSSLTTNSGSTTMYPSVLAVENYVATAIQSGATPDATTTLKGKLKLAGDLAGTADLPTVPGLALKEPSIAAGTTAQYYRGDKTWQSLDKTAVGLGNVDNTSDLNKPISTAAQLALDAKASLASPALTGTPTAPTAVAGTSTTQLATTAFVSSAVTTAVTNAATPDATTTLKGKLKLAGDLAGTADLPTVPGLALKEPSISAGTTTQYFRGDKTWQTLDKSTVGLGNVDNTSDVNKPISTATQSALDVKAPLASPALTGIPTAPTATAGTSTTQVATTAFVTNAVTSASTPDATNILKGKIQLTGDLGGTAASPTVPGLALKEPSIAAGTTTQYFRGDKTWQTLDKTAVGLGNVDNTSDVNKPISTATQAALDGKAPLASPALTGIPTAPTATAGTSTTQIATTAFVTSALSSATVPVSAFVSGIVNTSAGQELGGVDKKIHGVDIGTGSGNSTYSTRIGMNALSSNDGSGIANTAIGYNAIKSAITGMFNTSIGTFSMENAQSNLSTIVGYSAGRGTLGATSFQKNTLIGAYAGSSLTSGSYNIILSNDSDNVSTGSENIIVGHSNLTTGNKNVVLGGNINNKITFPTTGTSNAIAIGDGDGNIRLYADNLGNIGVGTTSPTEKLDVVGSIKQSGVISSFLKADANGKLIAASTSDLMSAIQDASVTSKGIIKLAGDLAGTADAPTVPGLLTKAPLASPALTGIPTAPTATAGTNTTQLATTAFVTSALGTPVSATVAGIVNNVAGQELGGKDKKINGIDIGVGGGNISSNTRVGAGALAANTTGGNNTAFGNNALKSVTTGNNNTSIGASGGMNISSGSDNIAIGYNTLKTASTSGGNVAIGNYALELSTNNYSTAIGDLSGRNSTGGQNTFIGRLAGNGISATTTGGSNTFIGYSAGRYYTTGSNNIVLTSASTDSLTSGNTNIMIGHSNLKTGSNNVVIGGNSGARIMLPSTSTTGVLALGDANGNIRLYTNAAGYTGIGTTNPTEALDITGSIKQSVVTSSLIKADATGKFVAASSADLKTILLETEEFTATASQTTFTITNTPLGKVAVFRNGIRIPKGSYTISGKTITYVPSGNNNQNLIVNDRITIDCVY
jgi:hypothetical protein